MKQIKICGLSYIIFFTIILALFPSYSSFAHNYETFAVIGDTNIGVREDIYKKFLSIIDKDNIRYLFIVGDVINRPGNEKEWNLFLELSGSKRVYHIAPGNHDINNTQSLKTYMRIFSRNPYYSFSDNDTQFIILCTEMPREEGRITGKQLEWLIDELKKPFSFRMVFLHRPPFPSILGKGYCMDQFPKDRDVFFDVLVKGKTSIVFAGHEHLYRRDRKEGVMLVTTGGGGARLLTYNEDYGGFFHYIVAKRSNDRYLFTVFDIDGKKRDAFSIHK